MTVDADRVAALIAEIAEREMLSRYRRLEKGAVRTKESPSDFVTIVDEAMERDLKRALLDATPGAAFIGEEEATANPAVMDKIETAERCWIVDPLDGTRNFVNHVDEFGVIAAYIERGETIAGWIYAAPIRAFAVAMRGEGVRWRGAAPVTAAQESAIPIGLRSTGWLREEWKARLTAGLKSNVRSRAGHCSAYAYIKLMTGEVDFKLSSRIHAWDHAAGTLILNELGGAARWLDTSAPYCAGPSADRPLLAVAPGRDWSAIARRLLD